MQTTRSTLQKVISRLETTRCSSRQTRLLIAPPLTKARLLRHLPSWIARWKLGRRREFATLAARALVPRGGATRRQIADEYHRYVAVPACTTLRALRCDQPDAIVLPDATFESLCRELMDDQAALVILVAHHSTDQKGIEFADGIWGWESILAVLKDGGVKKQNIVFLVCETAEYAIPVYTELESVGSIAYAWWPVPFPLCLDFAAKLIGQLDGKRYLEEAWQRAEDAFLNESFPTRDSKEKP